MKWKAFTYLGMIYGLEHLHPCILRFERPATGTQSAESYQVIVLFTSHCFTRAPMSGEAYESDLFYRDDYERRVFDFRRYTLSKMLPELIQELPARKPFHNSNRGNYLCVEIIAESGNLIEYDIFFKVKKISKGKLELIVETAFVRDRDHKSVRPKGRPVSFWVILHHTLNNIKIRA